MDDPTRLLLYFGKDLTDQGPAVLRKYYSRGFTLIPLDSSAIGMASEGDLPVMWLDAYMGSAGFALAKDDSRQWAEEWFLPLEPAMTSSGICWPSFDREAMHWFWPDVAAASHFAAAFQRKRGQILELFATRNQRPGLYYHDSDVHASLLKSMLKERVNLLQRPRDSRGGDVDRLKMVGIRFDEENVGYGTGPGQIKGKVVLAINPGESHRFQPVLRDLSRFFPGRTAVVMIFPNRDEARYLSSEFDIPVVLPTLYEYVDPKRIDRFQKGFDQLRGGSEGELYHVFNSLDYHFAYFCRYRWPILDSNFNAWMALWTSYRPAAVIISSLPDAESQLPAEAANRMAIPTFSLPHCEFSPREEYIVDIDHLLCNTTLSREVLKSSGYSQHRIELCKEIIHVDEHRTVPSEVMASEKTWNMVVLTYPITGRSHFVSSGHVSNQVEALRILGNPPEHYRDRLAIVVKPHPSEPEIELFSVAGGALMDRVCQPKVRLHRLLAGADIVVALNCSYSVIIHTLRFGKPVIFFYTDPFYRNGLGTHKHAHLLVPAGILAGNRDELWRIVEQFFTDSAFAHELTSKARAFARENLDDSHLPTIGQVVKRCLEEKADLPTDQNASGTPTIQTLSLPQLLPELDAVEIDLVESRQDYGELLPEEVVAICKIARHCRPSRIFEFGTFQGGTTLRLAANTAADILTFDLPPRGHPDYKPPPVDDPDLDVYPETPGSRFHNSPYAERIRQIYGDSQTFDFSPYFETMDFVFVDACHHYEFALRDSMNAFKMIRPGGIIVWHDYAEWAPGVMRALEQVSRRFPLFHVAGTSLVVYWGDREPAGRIQKQLADKTLKPPDISCASSRTEKDSAGSFLEKVKDPLPDQPGKKASAKAALLEQIAQLPGDIEALVNLAEIAESENNPDEALAFLKDVLILDPDNERAHALKDSIEKRHKPG